MAAEPHAVRVKAGAGLSTEPDPLTAGTEAAQVAAGELGDPQADLALVFASGSHLAAPEALLEGVNGVMSPPALIGCGAGGVLGGGRELESGSAVAVWAATLGAGEARAFHARLAEGAGASFAGPGEDDSFQGLPDLHDARGAIMLPDPYSFPTDRALVRLAAEAPDVPVLGGIASAGTEAGTGSLFLGEEVCELGAVGVSIHGVEMIPCVSQGAAPVGREVTITSAEGNVIHELAGRPALATIERIIADLSPHDRARVATGLLIGIVVERGKPDYEQGDFLVRGVLGADPESGSLVVGASVRTGQVLRLQVRDARSADHDLRQALRLRVQAMAGKAPAGALVFSCNGRGRAMFGIPDHDAEVVNAEFGGAPAAGFFAAGEIGPIGTRSFLHGFTATVAVFPETG